jgi:hypothetical protein
LIVIPGEAKQLRLDENPQEQQIPCRPGFAGTAAQ